MDTIEVGFPRHIPKDVIIFTLQSKMKQKSDGAYDCKVKFVRLQNINNVYSITCKHGEPAFYIIGMLAQNIINDFPNV